MNTKKIDSTALTSGVRTFSNDDFILNETTTEIKEVTISSNGVTSKIIKPKKRASKKKNKPLRNTITFKSTNFDYEDKTDILYTRYETSYHIFDFNNKTITLKAKLGTNKLQTWIYKWTKATEPYNNGYIEFTIANDKDVYQIWKSAANNIGYELRQGTKFVYYDVQRIN